MVPILFFVNIFLQLIFCWSYLKEYVIFIPTRSEGTILPIFFSLGTILLNIIILIIQKKVKNNFNILKLSILVLLWTTAILVLITYFDKPYIIQDDILREGEPHVKIDPIIYYSYSMLMFVVNLIILENYEFGYRLFSKKNMLFVIPFVLIIILIILVNIQKPPYWELS
jgi:hypothetical protein